MAAIAAAVGLWSHVRAAAVPAPTGFDRWREWAGVAFHNYGREPGDPAILPTALAQDGDGFIWIGAQSGLSRWDGYEFRRYDGRMPGGDHGLPDGWIQALHTDASGRLWVGTDAAGLALYDRDHDTFASIPLGPASQRQRHIGAIGDDGAGGVWVGADDGLYHISSRAGSAGVAAPDLLLTGERVQALLLDPAGRLWVGTDKGLALRNPADGKWLRIAIPSRGGADTVVSALFADADGRIWIGTAQNGLFVIERGGLAPRPVTARDATGWTLSTARVSAIASAGAHELWVGTRATGIVDIDTTSGRVRRILHDQLVPDSLAHDDVWAVLRDRAGSMWIGGSGGLSYRPRDPGALMTVFGGTTRATGISAPDVAAVLAARDGRIWLGFLNGGVDVIDPGIGRVTRLRPDPARVRSALPRDVVTDLAQAQNGDVYIGTPRGLYRADGQGAAVALVTPLGRPAHGYVRALFVDNGELWIGGPDGIWRMPLSGGAGRPLRPADFVGLSDQSIMTFTRGAGSDLWIGTRNGLDRLDLKTGVIEAIRADPGDDSALPARLISTLVVDRHGRLWVGTFGGGLAVMTGRDGRRRPRFRRIGLADGLPNLNVDRLLADRDGLVWASTDDGLAVMDPDTFRLRALRRAEGAALTVFWVKSGAVDAEGDPMFGAEGGLVVARPGWPTDWRATAPIVVTDIRVASHPVPGGRFNGGGSKAPLVLTAGTDSVSVAFAALDFSAPERNRYAYRLDGFDRTWIEVDATRRMAAYTNLAPGDYVLRLRGSNRDGAWSPTEIRIPIHVAAAWYQTLWFELAVGLALALAAIAANNAVMRGRTAALRRRQSELELGIARRTADLRAANARLSALVTIDPLTGCANRRRFMERAQELVELGRRGVPMTLAVMDLDNFKLINDRFGHPVGDAVLRSVGGASRERMRSTDIIGRIGGEEFAILMANTRLDEAIVLIERLRAALAEVEVRAGDGPVRITASLGLAEQGPAEDFDALYARADAALYAAKAAGRDQLVVAAPPAGGQAP